jgi:hypothetical protein
MKKLRKLKRWLPECTAMCRLDGALLGTKVSGMGLVVGSMRMREAAESRMLIQIGHSFLFEFVS